jgi:alkanesulfonate monooxygenase SsuD/methylene tetrahydromethanopterin reductase-like flavin-dependent oxidoreductase (luciferase family)
MTNVQLGFCMPAEFFRMPARATVMDALDHALNLVAGHFHGAWIVDHLQSGDAALLEGFTALTYLAARHPRLTFGHNVLCQSFRSPALVAKMAATLQFMSGGRFILGMGAGWSEEEYWSYGYDFPSAGVRVAQLEEALQIIRAMWTQDRATFEGIHYRVRDARCEPRPDPLPPVMVGAFRPKMLRLVARYADWWNASSSGVARYRRMTGQLERACTAEDRDPATVRRTWSGGCACAPTQEEAERVARDRFCATSEEDDFGFVGTPVQVLAQLHRFIALGVDYFILDCSGFPNLTTLELLVNEVIPALRD